MEIVEIKGRKLYTRKSRKKVPRTKVKKKTKKESFAAIMRRYGLPSFFSSPKHLRYRNPIEKGIYWYHFSLSVRRRDVEKWGTCISCGRPITVDTAQAGHFMPAGNCGRDLLFDPRNVNAECYPCNGFDEAHLVGYARNLDLRYGAGTAQELWDRREVYKASQPPKDWSRSEYEAKITTLLQTENHPASS